MSLFYGEINKLKLKLINAVLFPGNSLGSVYWSSYRKDNKTSAFCYSSHLKGLITIPLRNSYNSQIKGIIAFPHLLAIVPPCPNDHIATLLLEHGKPMYNQLLSIGLCVDLQYKTILENSLLGQSGPIIPAWL